ncbi:MAG: hypothetical protein D6692_01170 [Planctomycetota bacterium]|nr:MAG: hypothetical protein D6692_01170 [Planctomycetota bacterium]
MSTHTAVAAASISDRLTRLERSNARWRLGFVAVAAGLGGVLIGGMVQPRQTDYDYVATDDTIYRVDEQGRFSYIKFENGWKSADGYFSWGEVRMDPNRRYETKPHP